MHRLIPDADHLILHEDDQILVCHKPSDLPVQTSRVTQPDLESLLRSHLAKQSADSRITGKGTLTLHVIHRLDTYVEGVLVFAKTKAAAAHLTDQIREGTMQKHYRAIVSGVVSPKEGSLCHYMKKENRGGSHTAILCSPDAPGAKKARLNYTAIEENGRYTRLDILLHTGRFHQIRLQLSAIGHPIAGDRKYGRPDRLYPSIQLCAYCLSFNHPSKGKPMTFSIPDTMELR